MKEDEVTQLQTALDKVKSEMGMTGSHRMEMTLVQEKIKQGRLEIVKLKIQDLHRATVLFTVSRVQNFHVLSKYNF